MTFFVLAVLCTRLYTSTTTIHELAGGIEARENACIDLFLLFWSWDKVGLYKQDFNQLTYRKKIVFMFHMPLLSSPLHPGLEVAQSSLLLGGRRSAHFWWGQKILWGAWSYTCYHYQSVRTATHRHTFAVIKTHHSYLASAVYLIAPLNI